MNSKHYGRVGINPFLYTQIEGIGTKKKGKTNECGNVLVTLSHYGIVKKRRNVRSNPLIIMQLVTVKEEKKKKKKERENKDERQSVLAILCNHGTVKEKRKRKN